MTRFKDLGIVAETKAFTGDKIKIDRLLNREITVLAFRIEKSKHNDGDCLYLQIQLNGNTHVVFTGSIVLMSMIKKVPADAFPFQTTIVKENDAYQFT